MDFGHVDVSLLHPQLIQVLCQLQVICSSSYVFSFNLQEHSKPKISFCPFQKPLQLRLPWLPCGRCSQSFFVSQQSGVRMRRVPLAASLLLPTQQLCCKAQSSATPRLQQDHTSSAPHSCLGQGQWVATCRRRRWGAWDLGWAHIPISA